MMIEAVGTLNAIAQSFGKKGNHAMRNFQRSLGGSGSAAVSDSADMHTLRNRISNLIELPTAQKRRAR